MKANSGSAQQNVVMGISMGGLVTRYCLASMTKRGINPQTRLLITHDSPHQGSYVPLAFEHLILGLQNTTILGVRLGSIHHGALDEAVALLQSPAAQQELVMAVADANGNVTQNTFLATTYRNMITFSPNDPQPQYRFIATAQGSQCGISPLPVGATLASGSASGSGSGSIAFLTHGIIARWKYYTEINASGLTGNANHQILHFLMRRLQRLFFGLIDNNKTIALLDRYEPAFNNLPWESIPGGVESLADRLHTGNSLNTSWSVIAQWFLGYNYSFTLANRWGFLPVFSALDITTPITPATIYNTYLQGITPAGVSRAADFIAQEQFGATGSPQYNQPHTTFTARNSEWIYDQMQGTVYIDCFRDCAPGSFSILGNNIICTNENYALTPIPAGTGVIWSASPQGVVNIVANGAQATISAVGSGNVTITATVTNNCTGQTTSATKTIAVGIPDNTKLLINHQTLCAGYPVEFGAEYGALGYCTLSQAGITDVEWDVASPYPYQIEENYSPL